MEKLMIIIVIAFVFAGCSASMPNSSPMPTSNTVSAPSGWTQYKNGGGNNVG